jgi:hypothetical protein
MKPVRTYKDNIRENVLRSLLFNNTVIYIAGAILIALLLFFTMRLILGYFAWDIYSYALLFFEGLFAFGAFKKHENQPLFSLLPRALLFIFSKKTLSSKTLEKTTGDFKIVSDYVERRKSLISIYEIIPYDIALLNEEEQTEFYQNIKQTLHTFPSKIQIVVRKAKATVADYQKHFFSVYKQSDKKREAVISNYYTDLTNLINSGKLRIVKYYAVFSTPLASDNEEQFLQATRKLEDNFVRFSTPLKKIEMRKLHKEELISYFKTQFQAI